MNQMNEAVVIAPTADEDGQCNMPLSAEERMQLAIQETVIGEGLKKCFEVGAALAVIQDARLSREQYSSFEEYLEQRWGISRSYAYQLIAAAKVRANLATSFETLPANEFQARPLSKLEPEQQKKAWERVLELAEDEGVTNKIVEAVVKDMAAMATPPVTSPDNVHVDLGGLDQYLSGAPLKVIPALAPNAFDLLLISDLPGSTPAAAGKHLTDLLSTAKAVMKANHQVLVFTAFPDYRDLLSAAEKAGYEYGLPFVWITDAERSPVKWSAKSTVVHVLHLRFGDAALANRISNGIKCDEEQFKSHPAQKPLALIRLLVEAATRAGDNVLDPYSRVATTNVACRLLGRGCVGIDGDPESHAAGVERLSQASAVADLDQDTEETPC